MSTATVQRRDTDWPRGQQERSPEHLRFIHAIDLRTKLPDIPTIRGQTYEALRKIFKPTIQGNNRGLRAAFINDHSIPHMDRIASGVFGMGRNYMDVQQLAAVTLATRFHDIGYDFPPHASDDVLRNLGKEKHAEHAEKGADMFANAVEDLLRSDSRIQKELPWWNQYYTDTARKAILLHSNSSNVSNQELMNEDNGIDAVMLLPRLIDKLDNTADRVFPEHMDRLKNGLHHRSIQGIKLDPDSSGIVSFANGHKKDYDRAMEFMNAVDSHVPHRLAPYAITDQQLELDRRDLSLRMNYIVHTGRVREQLDIPFGPEDHMRQMMDAYDRCFENAAATAHAIRIKLIGVDMPNQPILRVCLQYAEEGKRHEIEYTAREAFGQPAEDNASSLQPAVA